MEGHYTAVDSNIANNPNRLSQFKHSWTLNRQDFKTDGRVQINTVHAVYRILKSFKFGKYNSK